MDIQETSYKGHSFIAPNRWGWTVSRWSQMKISHILSILINSFLKSPTVDIMLPKHFGTSTCWAKRTKEMQSECNDLLYPNMTHKRRQWQVKWAIKLVVSNSIHQQNVAEAHRPSPLSFVRNVEFELKPGRTRIVQDRITVSVLTYKRSK